jgi:hypothetical protein
MAGQQRIGQQQRRHYRVKAQPPNPRDACNHKSGQLSGSTAGLVQLAV